MNPHEERVLEMYRLVRSRKRRKCALYGIWAGGRRSGEVVIERVGTGRITHVFCASRRAAILEEHGDPPVELDAGLIPPSAGPGPPEEKKPRQRKANASRKRKTTKLKKKPKKRSVWTISGGGFETNRRRH
jgi:hypothetical protein